MIGKLSNRFINTYGKTHLHVFDKKLLINFLCLDHKMCELLRIDRDQLYY